LTTDGRVRLSTLGRLEHATFARLLELLGMALGRAPDSGGRRRATTSDGQLEVVLHPDGGGRVVLHTPLGRFDAPDYAVEIRSTLAAAGPTERREQPLQDEWVSL
jgi:hypothetical protein